MKMRATIFLTKKPDASPDQNQRRGERGNVLIYILLAIALLAGLSFAVANSSRNSGGQISQERMNMAVNEILEISNNIAAAVTQLTLRGCSHNQISFQNPVVAGYANPTAPVDNSCDVYHINGGGLTYQAPQTIWFDPAISTATANYGEIIFTANTCINQVGTGTTACDTAGASAADLIMAIPYLHNDICIELNRRLSVGAAGAAPPQDDGAAWDSTNLRFTGAYNGGAILRDTDGVLDGKRSGCFEADTTPVTGFHYFRVLIAR
ncbi:MAG: hypothetical protein ACK4VI_03880 [Alphaproteobacteria bacterium]